MASCYKCGKPITVGIEGPVPPAAVCEHCSSWLHSCANCTFYDEYTHSKCREPKAEFVFDRLGKNECAFFKLKASANQQDDQQRKRQSPRMQDRQRGDKAREKLESLFRK